MDTIQQTKQYEEYQGSQDKSILALIWKNILWLVGYCLMYVGTAAMCVEAVLNGMDNPSFGLDRYTRYTKPLPAYWDWISGWSHIPTPIVHRFPNATWFIMLITGACIFGYYCENVWVRRPLLGIYALILLATIYLGTKYLGVPLI